MLSLIPLPIKLAIAGALVSLILVAALFGYMKGREGSKIELANYRAAAEKQISDLKDMNSKISNKVVVQYVDRINTIREKETRYVDLATNNVPNQFELSNGWVHTHDASASSNDADPARSADANSSGVKDNQALVTVVRNYATCESNAEQLKNLQQWIRDNQAAIEEVNKKKKRGIF